MTPPTYFEANNLVAAELRQQYDQDGYVVIKNVFTASETDELKKETAEIAMGKRGDILGADVVSNGVTDAEQLMSRLLAIHFPHKVSSLMRQTIHQPSIVSALNAIIGPDVKCMQSMLFLKHAGMPGQAWHQDEHYIPTRDQSLAGVWIALDDARVDNGGLWMHPGSHKPGIIWPTREHGDPRFDSAAEAYDFPYDREGGVAVDADAGDVVIFHGYVLHRSLNNTRDTGFRRALVNHVMSARSMLPWSMGIPPTPREDFRDIVMVSGKDHYDWKGFEDITVPFIRPDDADQVAEIFGKMSSQASARLL